jgi:hypothetical protein
VARGGCGVTRGREGMEQAGKGQMGRGWKVSRECWWRRGRGRE